MIPFTISPQEIAAIEQQNRDNIQSIAAALSELLIAKLEERFSQLSEAVAANAKAVLSLDELADYTGLSERTLKDACYAREIPHYRCHSKYYFKRTDIEDWLLSARVSTREELNRAANSYIAKANIRKTAKRTRS